MTANEIRNKYLKFFESKGHKILPSASLVPENDPTVLFTTAGMHPLVPYLLGEKHPLGKRLVNCQKCLRTDDIDEVGDNTHLTFFEMLGNWSLGDYFKEESIKMSFEFLVKELKIPLERLAVSVFAGDEYAPRDEEAAGLWQKLGVKKERIAYLDKKDNWWGPAGKTGPCGPDTEMFYWTGHSLTPETFDANDKKWVEIWNNVFMQYNKTADEAFEELKQKNVDTGMGLERITAVLQNKDNMFETDLFASILKAIKRLAKKQDEKAERIIADHIKASVFLLAEKVCPSNVGQGYVLRKLIRRAIRYGRVLGIEGLFLQGLAKEIFNIYRDIYLELEINNGFILKELEKEELTFSKTLANGLKEFTIMAQNKNINGKNAFLLYQSFGFPIEITKDLAKEQGIGVDEDGFEKEFCLHQQLSRTATVGQFKSGLADHSGQTIKYHTTAHLLLAALRKVLGCDVEQRGSNITAERLRFDFAFGRKLTAQEIENIEGWVNKAIQAGLDVCCSEMPIEEAQKQGASASFRERYPEIVKVFIAQDEKGNIFSNEICSGPHVKNTKDLGVFKITKEESSSGGVRRIKAILQ